MIETAQYYVFDHNSYHSHLAKIYSIYKVSYMGAHVLLNLLYKVKKRYICTACKACQAFYHFFATRLINSVIHEIKC